LYLSLIIFVFAFLLYGNTIQNNYSIDDTYVTQNNPRVEKGIAGIPEILTSRYVDEEGNSFGYRPVAVITFAIEHELWGQNPHLGHLINLLLYSLILLILLKILQKIFSSTHILFLLSIILLFAAHPIHTEVVASLKNRETILSFLFSLASLSFFLRWFDSRRILPAIWGCLFFILAFLSKQDAITFAAVIPLVLYYHSSESISFGKLIDWRSHLFTSPNSYLTLATISFFGFYLTTWGLGALPALIFYFSTLVFLILYFRKTKNKNAFVKGNRLSWLFLLSGILLFTIAIYYLKPGFAMFSLVCFAVFFSRILETAKIREISIPKYWLALFIPLVLIGVTGVVIYMLPNLYLPAENKIMYKFENPQFVNDPQFTTYPLAFYTLFFYLQKLAWPHPLGFYYGFKMIPEVGFTSPEVIFSIVLHIALLIFALTRMRQKHVLSFAILYYLFTISIFSNIIIKIPGIVGERLMFFPSLGFCIALAWMLFRILSINIYTAMISRQKIIQLSLLMLLIMVPFSMKTIIRNAQWKDYLTLYLHDIKYLANSAKANHIYASQLLKEAFTNDVKNPSPEIQQQYLNLAVQHLKKTVEIDSTYKFAWNNLGYITYQYLGRKQEGIGYLQKAIQADPDYENAHFNLGFAYKQQGLFDKSIHHLEEAHRINPRNTVYLTEKADAFFRKGDVVSAVQFNEEAARLNPKTEVPYINIGNIYWLSHDTLEAIANWEKALEVNPNNLEVCSNLYKYFNSKGDIKAGYYRSKTIDIQQYKH
jgi:tetratricopeptide (TPR) repeat protein